MVIKNGKLLASRFSYSSFDDFKIRFKFTNVLNQAKFLDFNEEF